MPRLLKDFPAAEPGSLGTYSIDFAPYIPPGTSVLSAAWSLSLHATLPGVAADIAPQTRLVGAAQVADGTIAVQRIGNLVSGNDYLVTATGTTSDGEIIILWTVLPCRAPQ